MFKIDSLERVREASIADVATSLMAERLHKQGSDLVGCCPFPNHNEKTPSFHVSESRGRYKCFGCDKGGDAISLVMEIKGYDFADAVRYIAQECNIPIEEEHATPEAEAAHKAYMKKKQLIEDIKDYCFNLLWSENDNPNIRNVLVYLTKRYGYDKLTTNEEENELLRKLQGREFGFLQDREQLRQYLISKKGYTPEELDASMINCISKAQDEDGVTMWQKSAEIEKQHNLVVPIYRYGKLVDFVYRWVRRTDADIEPSNKYLKVGVGRWGNTFDFVRKNRDNEVILVEGQLDAITADIYGVDNVAAIGTNKIKEEAVKDVISHGIENITLCLDTDATAADPNKNNKNTAEAIDRIMAAVRSEEAKGNHISVYVATLPSENPSAKIDPHDYIMTHGAEAFKEVIAKAKIHYKAQCDIARDRCLIAGDTDRERSKKWDEEYAKAYAQCTTAADKISFKEYLLETENQYGREWAEAQIDTMQSYADKIAEQDREREAKERQNKANAEAVEAIKAGNTDKAVQILLDAKNEASDSKREYFEQLSGKCQSVELLKAAIDATPDMIGTGLKLKEYAENAPTGATHEISLPPREITFIAGRTGHGKTALMLNMAINLAKNGSDKIFPYISLEEDETNLQTKAMAAFIGKATSYLTNKDNQMPSTDDVAKFDRMLKRKGILFNDMGGQSADVVMEYIRYLNAKYQGKVGGVFIDYMQLMHLVEIKGQFKFYSRTEELKLIAERAKAVAKELNIPIVIGAQFRRETLVSTLLTDNLAESSEIEKIAAILIGLWKVDFDMKNNINDESPEGKAFMNSVGLKYDPHTQRNMMYCEYLKHRGGKSGIRGLLHWNYETGRIQTLGEENQVTGEANESNAPACMKLNN